QLEYNYFNYGSSSFQSQPTAVRITTLNNRLETKKDSLIKNNGNYYKIHPGPYAQFMLHNTPYLVLVEELVAKKRGLVLIRPDENNEVHTTSLRVYNQFSFLLSLLQTAGDNSFVVPFINKKEIGLMKVTLTE
ncbi:MAG: hypothetical protein GXC73_05435, partial [Chitinophagaceae bacterium]|nr:hypothetical protein [Chitinophagaceae bacterium]